METWALLIDWIGNEFADELTDRVQRSCRAQGRALVVFTLGSLSYHLPEAVLEEQVGRVLRSPRLDRVLWSAGQIVRGGGDEKLRSILSRMPRRPTLTMGARIGSLAFLEVHHDGAFRLLLDHLWDDHGFRRFAWVGGPPDNPVAQARRAVFLDYLKVRGAELPSAWDCPGDFNLSAGREAGERLRPYASVIDVVVAANDAMAVGIREVLGPVPVTGFDNQSSAVAAGLTTVDTELDQEVDDALRCLEVLGPGDEDPPSQRLGRLVIRSSCGCAHAGPAPHAIAQGGPGSTQRTGPLFDAILGARDLSELAQGMNRALPAEGIGYWKVLAGSGDFWPEGAEHSRPELVVHSLFRDEELFGYLVHDLSNRNYPFSEWLRINLSLTFASWHRQANTDRVQKVLQGELDRFARKQKEVEDVINALPVWIVELDRRFQLRYGNHAWKQLVAHEANERPRGPFLDFVAPGDRQRVENRLAQALRSRQANAVDFRLRGERGIAVWGGIQPLELTGRAELAPLFGALHGDGGLRLVGLDLSFLVASVVQPDQLIWKHFALSPREQQVLQGVIRGDDSSAIAKELGIAPSTVRVLLHRLYSKTGAANRKELLDCLLEYNARVSPGQSLTQILVARLLGGTENESLG